MKHVSPGLSDASLKALLDPKIVALVGASPDFGRYGGRVWRFLHALPFDGEIFAVNPKYGEIEGRPCYPSLSALPSRPEHVGIAVAADRVMSVMAECAALGIRAVTLFSAGYGERGTAAGNALQAELVAFARAHGIRVLGPNCNGLINWKSRLAMSATTAVLERDVRTGPIGIVSQSGGVGQINVMWRAIRAGLGISYQVACGNEADVDTLDIVDFMIDDVDTKMVLMAVEGLRNGPKLAAVAAKAARARKPILVYKVGRSAGGAAAAASHTGSMTGADAVHDAALAQLGILRVEQSQHLYEAAMFFAQGREVDVAGVSSTSVSGGCIAMIADEAERFGLEFPDYAPETVEALARIIPGFLTVANPTDLSVDVQGKSGLNDVLQALAGDPNIGINLPILTMAPRRDFDALLAFAKASRKPAAIIWTGGCIDEALPEIHHVVDGIPIYRDIDAGLRATSLLVRHAAFLRDFAKADAPQRPTALDDQTVRRILRERSGSALTERASKAVLAAYGLPVTREVLAASADEAVAHFIGFGGPVAMKIEAAAITHKTDIGGVALNVGTAAGVAAAFDAIMKAARSAHPEAALNGVLIQEMAQPGIELILGCSRDPTYGPVLALGLGGIFAEYIGKPVLRLPPLSAAQARDMLDALPGRALLDGARGRPPTDLDRLCDIILRFSWLVADFREEIAEVDINPLIVAGASAVAVDALVICG